MAERYSPVTARLVTAIEQGEIQADIGYLVGLDRPAMLSPDPAALMAARRRNEVLAKGHRWRVVTEALWKDLLELGRERPEQRVYILALSDLENWMDNDTGFDGLDQDGWRGDQGTIYVVPVLIR
ncbi:hypothetical protein BH24CHL1_BH24CHL1_16550 [soil metagenome]